MFADTAELRRRIDDLVAAGDAHAARRLLEQAWRQNPGPASAAFVGSRARTTTPTSWRFSSGTLRCCCDPNISPLSASTGRTQSRTSARSRGSSTSVSTPWRFSNSPAERERVRRALPEVTVIDLPADPMEYACAVQESPLLQRLASSIEDRDRRRYDTADRRRAALRQREDSLESFYWSLSMEADIFPVTRETAARVAQLTHRTNQFNLTGRRHTEQDIAALVADSQWRLYALRLRDRFGSRPSTSSSRRKRLTA